MLEQAQYERIRRILPVLQNPDPQLAREFRQAAYFARLSAGRDVFAEGDEPDSIALLISGVVRVYKIGYSYFSAFTGISVAARRAG